MLEKDSTKDKRKLLCESPSKILNTPIKTALKKSNYKLGPFLEIMNSRSKVKSQISKTSSFDVIEDSKENQSLDNNIDED